MCLHTCFETDNEKVSKHGYQLESILVVLINNNTCTHGIRLLELLLWCGRAAAGAFQSQPSMGQDALPLALYYAECFP